MNRRKQPTAVDVNMATALQADQYKVIVIGALGVGKTSILLRYIHDQFETRISRFVSEEKKAITVNGKELILDIWDTAGQERFQSITNRFYSDTHAVVIVYDVTSEESFHDVDYWVREVQYYLTRELDENLPVLFVGNKKDLLDRSNQDQKIVKLRQAQEIANAHGFLKPIECSAKTGDNVGKIFETLAQILIKRTPGGNRPKVNTTDKRSCSCST